MKPFALMLAIGLTVAASVASAVEAEEGWKSLFDGATYGQWKANENTDSWQIKDGCFVCQGPRSHLFYMGEPVKTLELKIDVMTEPGSNSGIYFHTKYQDKGWPE